MTGSSIKRAEIERASAVQVITRDDIDKSAKTTVAAYLQTLTADGQGSVPTTFGRGFAAGSAAGISLRGLGVNATLVLVNGRRVAPSVLADDAQRLFVDLNTIPLDAVDRIEVLKEGASVIYGSDAVAGVVNIILRKTFNGTVVKASYGISAEGDGANPRVALLHGFGDLDKDRYNVLLNLDATRTEPIYYRDRVGRGTVGKSALYGLGFAPGDNSGFNVARMAGKRLDPGRSGHGTAPEKHGGHFDHRQRPRPVDGSEPGNNYYQPRQPRRRRIHPDLPCGPGPVRCPGQPASERSRPGLHYRLVAAIRPGAARQPERQLLRPVHRPARRGRGVCRARPVEGGVARPVPRGTSPSTAVFPSRRLGGIQCRGDDAWRRSPRQPVCRNGRKADVQPDLTRSARAPSAPAPIPSATCSA